MANGNNNGNGQTVVQGVVEAARLPRRMLTPAEIHARAQLEFTHYPLYSSVIIPNTVPRENPLFGYALGDTVSGTPAGGGGTIVANDLFTNMETARFLANPKMFVCQGISAFVSALNFNSGAAPSVQNTVGATGVALNQPDNLQLLWYTGLLRFFVGNKDYAQAPLFRFPANTGIEGLAALAHDDDATGGLTFAVAAMPKGIPWTMDTYPVTIYPQQTFGASIDFKASTSNVALAFNSMATVALRGILGRETQ